MLPLAFKPEQINHQSHWLLVMGRLKEGVSLQQANAEMQAITRQLAEEFPQSNANWEASVEPLQNNFIPEKTIKNLWLLTGRGRFPALDFLRQHRQPAAGARHDTPARGCYPSSPRRNARATVRAVPHRELGVGGHRRRVRYLPRRVNHRRDCGHPPISDAAFGGRRQNQHSSAAVHALCDHVRWLALRLRASLAGESARPQRSAQARRAHGHGRRRTWCASVLWWSWNLPWR